MKLAFSVDDLSPLYGFEHLDLLHEALGLKFDAFIPSNHEGRALLADNPGWVQELKNRDWIQPNIHGVKHRSESGSTIEYQDLDYKQFLESIGTSITQFKEVGINVCGIKAPGWDVNHMDDYFRACSDLRLKYICTHYIDKLIPTYQNNTLPTFGYTLCVHEIKDSICGGEADIILHSHIDPSQGQNGLTNELVNHILTHLMPIAATVKEFKPVFLKECL